MASSADEVLARTTAAAEEGVAKAKEAAEVATQIGFLDYFQTYALTLLLPWNLITENKAFMDAPDVKSKALVLVMQSKDVIIAAATLTKPSTEAEMEAAFTLYNVLGFWLGVFESLVYAILGHGLLSLVWNGGVSFIVAYTLYWTMTKSKLKTTPKPFMFFSLVFIALYVVFNVYMGISKLLFIVPAILYFLKALSDVLMLINGWFLYQNILKPDESPLYMM